MFLTADYTDKAFFILFKKKQKQYGRKFGVGQQNDGFLEKLWPEQSWGQATIWSVNNFPVVKNIYSKSYKYYIILIILFFLSAEQIGLTPEEVVNKIMSNPEVATAFQNPRVQAAIMDVILINFQFYIFCCFLFLFLFLSF